MLFSAVCVKVRDVVTPSTSVTRIMDTAGEGFFTQAVWLKHQQHRPTDAVPAILAGVSGGGEADDDGPTTVKEFAFGNSRPKAPEDGRGRGQGTFRRRPGARSA